MHKLFNAPNYFTRSTLSTCFLVTLCAFLHACSSTPTQAPVSERNAQAAKKPAPPVVKPLTKPNTDWRPDTYTVKKGDTLFSIGLQYGYDYKEIAQLNSLTAPFSIKIGQELKLKDPKTLTNPSEPPTDGVTTAPLKQNAVITGTGNGEAPFINDPKALREPYSDQALLAKPATSPQSTENSKTSDAKSNSTSAPTPTLKTTPPANDINTIDDDAIAWTWPTTGKVTGTFSDNNKGIDIVGTHGQAINAAATGRVIYSGSDLRGYGKLVIIKHNKNYLSVYAHNNQILVKEGQAVIKGQKIAEMGNSDADRYLLHFEIRQQGKSVDPSKLLPNN
jgi:lipoprotein NlpD